MMRNLTILVAACLLLAPLMPAQSVDAPGVTVNLGGATLMHRSGVPYPKNLQVQQGTVTAQVTLDQKGNVADAQVLSGPVELRRTVLESVLQWHFAHAGGTTRQVSVTFQTPAQSSAVVTAGGQSAPIGVQGGVLGAAPAGEGVRIVTALAANEPQKLTAIQVSGFNEQLKGELLAALPVHEGDMVSGNSMSAIQNAVRQYDEHLSAGLSIGGNGEVALRISGPGAVAGATTNVANWSGIKVDAATQATKVIRKVAPAYPAIARQARVQDHVILNARIGADGTMQDLAVVSGHPLLRQAALDAVRQWVYAPTLLNGQPVQVVTQIDINFSQQE